MISKKDIAGAVILYNSSMETLDNVKTYVNQVDALYIIDNSTVPNQALIEAFRAQPEVHYHSMGGNKGIATALNRAAREALSGGFSVLLTMDDDTRTPTGMVAQMVDFWNDYPEPIGILSGVHHNRPDSVPHRSLSYTLTSGNLLNLVAYQAIDGFRDDLFIDHVDHEYGFRLNNAGYRVVEITNIHLEHKLGYSEQAKIGPWVVRKYGTNTPIRLYYYARNGMYVSRTYFKQHPDFAWMFAKEMTRRWIKTLFLDKDRLTRINMLWGGMMDGWQKRLGRYKGEE